MLKETSSGALMLFFFLIFQRSITKLFSTSCTVLFFCFAFVC
ncbi:hypothetical protein NC651_007309 [Populus alba x Populus x berolinensis]|nr:hypothetical protein NC651_007309 [Populus alba x Populus x berolinensis]